MTPQEKPVIRRRPPTPEERERFRKRDEEVMPLLEEEFPEIVTSLERAWKRNCLAPVSQLESGGVFSLSAAVASLKAAREAKEMTLDAVAAAVGTSTQAIAAIEAGEDKAPLPRILGRYAAALGMRFVTGLAPIE